MVDSFSELVRAILPILPGATFGDDNEGQIIIYTNKVFVSDQTGEGTDDIVDMSDEVEPRCDICGEPEDHTPGMIENDWNGETGNHLSCETKQEDFAVDHGISYRD